MPGNITIRKATKDDAKGKGFVHYTSWIETYTGLFAPKYMERLSLERSIQTAEQHPENTYVALIDDVVVGFACYNEARDEDLHNTGEIMAIYILEDYQHLGIGSKLMKVCYKELSAYDNIIVWVLEANQSSKSFYQSHGFVPDGHTKEIYEETVIRMIQTGHLEVCSSRYTLDRIYDFFFSELNFNEKNEGYVRRRKDELDSQYKLDPELILYVTYNDEIISAIAMKHKTDKELTMAMLATKKEYQKRGIARRLVREIEHLAKEKGYSQISLGARISACGFYIRMNYNPSLLVQAFGNDRKDAILKYNIQALKLPIINTVETENCDYLFFEIHTIDETIVSLFKRQFKDIDVQYIFAKEL